MADIIINGLVVSDPYTTSSDIDITGSGDDLVTINGTATSFTNKYAIDGHSSNSFVVSADATLGMLDNTSSGMITSGSYGVLNNGTISSFTSNGTITGDVVGVYNYTSGIIKYFTNSETITSSTYGVYNYGTISSFTNSKTITGDVVGVDNNSPGTISSFINSGTVTSGTYGIYSSGTIDDFINSGTITSGTYGVLNSGTIDAFINSETITGGIYGVLNSGTIEGLTNSGAITGGKDGVFNSGTIDDFTNSGTITGGTYGVLNNGAIDTLTNSGTISGSNGGVGLSSTGNSTIINAKIISGGLNGDGTYADAVLFSGGGNTLTLESDYSFTGNVVSTSGTTNGGDTLGLGGNSNDIFDVSNIVTSAPSATSTPTKYSGFTHYEKTGTSTWALTGTTAGATPWTIKDGTLSISADNNLGDASSALAFAGTGNGILQITDDITMTRNVHLNAAGTFDTTGKNLAISGIIDGSSSLTKKGTGTLTLSGANTYSGGTAIGNGTLSISADNNLGDASSALTFAGTGNGILQITGNAFKSTSRTIVLGSNGGGFDIASADNNFTIAQALSGDGKLTKQGTGTLTLSGTNTYSGGTTIDSGTLQVGNGGSTGSITGNVANQGTLIFNRSGAVSLDGIISGSGKLTKKGAGTLTLSGTNTYSGGTTIDSGTLQVGNGGSTGSITGDIEDNAKLIFNRSGAVSLDGIISGSGELRQEGTGTLTLSGDNTYSGGTTIDSGTLQVGDAGHTDASIKGDVTLTGGTVGNWGTISGAAGINITGDNAAINNYGNGLIQSTDATNGIGVSVTGDNATIINNDKSTIAGATGIKITGNNTHVINKSNFTVKGTNYGIDISTGGSVITTDLQNMGGTIKATADSGVAINIAASGTTANPITISNKANDTGTGSTIEATGTNGIGINIANNSSYVEVTNGGDSGAVSTISGTAQGINITGNNTTITNNASGIIKYTGEKTTDYHNAAIYAAANTTINNYGTIDGGSDSGLAIAATAATAQTVNVYTGSKFVGAIDLAADLNPNDNTSSKLDAINIYDDGSKGSYLFQVKHSGSTNIKIKSGSNAVTVDKKNNLAYVQVVNATGAAMSSVQLNDLTSSLQGVISNNLQQVQVDKPVKVAALRLLPGMLHQNKKPQLWGQLFGSRTHRDAEGALSAYRNEAAGFVGGYQYAVGKSDVGVLVGFAKSSFTTRNNNQDDDTNSTYIGTYAQTHFSKLNLITSLIAGQENHDNRRKVASLAGTDIAKSNNGSMFLSPSVTLYSSFRLNDKLTLLPSTSLNYSIGHYDKYKETGADSADTTVKARTSDAALANMQLKLAYAIPAGEVDLKAGVQARYSDNDDIDMSLAGSDFSYKSGLDSTVYGSYAGIGANFALAKSFNLDVDSSYSEFSGGEHSVAGKVRLQYSF